MYYFENSQDLEDTEYGGGGAVNKRGRGRGRRRSRSSPPGGNASGEGVVPAFMTDENDDNDGAPTRPPGAGWRSPPEEGARSRLGVCRSYKVVADAVLRCVCVFSCSDFLGDGRCVC